MTDLIHTVLLGLTGAAVLIGIYSAMESSWPSAYVQITTREGQLGRFSLPFYLAFRIVPPFVTMGAVTVSAERVELSPPVVGVVGVLVYSLYVLLHQLQNLKGRPRRGTHILVTFIGLALAWSGCLFGFLFRWLMAPYIPEPKELLASLWTAAFCGVLYYSMKRVLDKEPDALALERRVRRDIGNDAWKYVEKASRGQSVAHIRSILMAEATQRPRWFRMIERVLQWPRGRWFRQEGTTGLAQMRNLEPLDDNRSIDMLCDNIVSWERVTGKTLKGDFEKYLRFHNPDNVFVESASEYLVQLESAKRESENAAPDEMIPAIDSQSVDRAFD